MASMQSIRVPSTTVSRLTECAICLETFIDPRMLPCGHTFCLDCLRTLIKSNSRNGQFMCSVCRRQCKPPNGDPINFPKNIYLGHLMEFDGESEVALTERCRKHKSQSMDFFCTRCKVPVCSYCCLLEHKDHTYEDISPHFERYRAKLSSVSATGEKYIAELKRAYENLQETDKQINKDTADATKHVNDSAEEICKLVNNRRDKIVENVLLKKAESLRKVQQCKEELNRRQTFAASLQEESKKLQNSAQMFQGTQTLEEKMEQEKSTPIESVRWKYKVSKASRDKSVIQELLGSVSVEYGDTESLPAADDNSDKCQLSIQMRCTGAITGLAVSESYICVVHWANPNLWFYGRTDGTLKAKCQIPDLRAPQGMVLTDNKQLRFIISCEIQSRLHFVKLSPQLKLLEHRKIDLEFQPHNLTLAPIARQLFIIDRSSHQLNIFSENGDPLLKISLPADLESPLCAVETGDEEFVVLDDIKPGNMLWMNRDGRTLYTYGSRPEEDLANPWHAVFCTGGQLLVADTFNHRLHVVDPSYKLDKYLLVGQGVRYPARVVVDEATEQLFIGHGELRASKISVYKYICPKSTAEEKLTHIDMKLQLFKF